MTNHLPAPIYVSGNRPNGEFPPGASRQVAGPLTMPPRKSPMVASIFSLGLAVLLLAMDVEAAPAATSNLPAAASASAKSGLKPLRVQSLQQLKRLLKGKHPATTLRGVEMTLAASAGDAASNKSLGAGGGTKYSSTNVQVQGVDEGDIVKTDGQYLYTLQDGQLRIIQAYPAAGLDLLASVKFEEGFYPMELFVDGSRLVVIGSLWKPSDAVTDPAAKETAGVAKMALVANLGENLTVARVFDISDKRRPVQEREVTFTGSYLTSRKVGDAVYLIGRTYPMFYAFAVKSANLTRDVALPKVSDSALNGGASRTLPLGKLSYFPGFVDPNYVIVAGFRLSQPDHPADIKSYLGAGDIAYASLNKLYLSAADYQADAANALTHLYSFAIDQGNIQFRNAGEVPGTALNQFSMDEHQGYFRIATTVHQWKEVNGSFQNKSWNNVYSLDNSMKVVGKLEHLADGESIYAARFMGDRAYLVTFEQTDPLFAIDLKDPTAPRAMGELILPGFSNYLHPYDSTHLLGIGQDTTAVGDGVQFGGMKLALFDVADISQPKLLHSVVIGEQGSYSDAMYDHKAVLFDPERHLLGFPVTETAKKAGEEWPSTSFQGAYVYDVSLDGGFTRKGAITQMPADNPYAWNRYIRRLLTIEDQLYTVSDGRVQANQLSDFALTGALDVAPVPKDEPVPVDIDPPVVKEPNDPGTTDGGATDPGAVACTMEVQLCPDGKTWVGRSGPSCSFAPCPSEK